MSHFAVFSFFYLDSAQDVQDGSSTSETELNPDERKKKITYESFFSVHLIH